MNPHFILLSSIVFACADRSTPIQTARWSLLLLLVALGIVLALVVWHIGMDFGVMRFWISLAVLFTPLLIQRSLR